ncbi:MAG: hypothetical protein ACFFC7_12770 [Candidatus Hermodarchaeota archaeon]
MSYLVRGCAGARKLFTVLWYLLQKNDRWKPPTLQDPRLIQALQTKIQQKIHIHVRQIERCEKLHSD